MRHLDLDELEAGLDHIRCSPRDEGQLELIVARPALGERHVLHQGALDLEVGLVGDNWLAKGSSKTADGKAHPDKQVTLINARLSALLGAGDADHRLLVGDQLHVDLDLSEANLPAGTHLALGDAVLIVTDSPHTGCAKFAARYGATALRFVNVGEGGRLRLRGINCRVVVPGTITAGDAITKVPAPAVV